MTTRKLFNYKVTLSDDRGSAPIDYTFATHWSRSRDFITEDSIGVAAAAQAFVEAKGQRHFLPVAVVAQ